MAKKRKASLLDSSSEDEISVEHFRRPNPPSSRVRAPVKPAVPKPPQKRARKLDCVLITPLRRPLTLNPISNPQPVRYRSSASADARAGTASKRPTGNMPARSYKESQAVDDDDIEGHDDEAEHDSVETNSYEEEEAVESGESQDFDMEMSDARPTSEEYTGSDTRMSDEEPTLKKPRKPSGIVKGKPTKRTASKGEAENTAADAEHKVNKTGKGGANQNHELMHSQVYRDKKKDPTGLDLGAAPLSNIDEIFSHLTTKALNNGLGEFLQQMGSHKLRVATMCSGTESPILALGAVGESLRKLGVGDLPIDHLFSAEIVPYKQAYIERNFHPPIIFRDITEMTYAPKGSSQATTAWGALKEIPKDLHLLVAGTSCVDFSNLNNHQKALDEHSRGESSRTWFAVLRYCKQYRPAVILFENVFKGPWADMIECYQKIGYEVAGVKVDTKNYYLPQTRWRGYLVCFDKDRIGGKDMPDAGEKWQNLMATFQRHASSPTTDFLSPNDLVRAKQRGVLAIKPETEFADWQKCEIRHIQYRLVKQLGNEHPFLHWTAGGGIIVPEYGIPDWYRKQVERIRDALEISILRKADVLDARYKTRIWDLSQNVDMSQDTAQFGITPCLTPSGTFFVSDASRALAPEETLKLQGMPLSKISFTTETPVEIQNLAGNAMSTTVVGSAILAALIAGKDVLHPNEESTNTSAPPLEPTKASAPNAPTKSVDFYCNLTNESIQSLVQESEASIQRCICEGPTGLTQTQLQVCKKCRHSACVSCGGNPSHDYEIVRQLNEGRKDPASFERELRSKLPLQLQLHVDCDAVASESEDAEILRQSTQHVFSLSHVKRDRHWTAVYGAPSAMLNLVIRAGKAEWRLFGLPEKDLPGNDVLRTKLQQPLAVATVKNSLYEVDWRFRTVSQQETPITVQGLEEEGLGSDKIPSWRSKIGLPNYRREKVWSKLQVSVPRNFEIAIGSSVSGTYEALPHCGTAQDSLYRRIGCQSEDQQIYLFQDPTRIGEPEFDCFVFSKEHEQLDYRQSRPVIASLGPTWKPHAKNDTFEKPLLSAPFWQTFQRHHVDLVEVVPEMQIHLPQNAASEALSCHETNFIASCTMPATLSSDDALNDEHAHALEAMRRQLPDEVLYPLSIAKECSNAYCAPSRPSALWVWKGDKGRIEPYEDPRAAAEYETAMKSRPQLIYLEVTRDTPGARVSTITFGVNLASLAHRATSRLVEVSDSVDAQLRWKLQQDSCSDTSLRSFRLSPTVAESYTQDLGLGFQLFAKQKIVLGWMIEQESGAGKHFMVEEAEETLVPSLDWRVEVRASAPIHVRGGICADNPGFGKTITSLTLIHLGLQVGQDAILKELRDRQLKNAGAKGLLPLQATLIVAPDSLVGQWKSEITTRLKYNGNDVLVVSTWKDLAKYRMQHFKRARIIIVSLKTLVSERYVQHLANFASTPAPTNRSGREYAKWLQHACAQLPDLSKILDVKGHAAAAKHAGTKLKSRGNMDNYKSMIPSRLKMGSESAAEQVQVAEESARYNFDKNKRFDIPVFEMFYFNRIILDEFQLQRANDYASVKALKADKRWGLSATPAMRDSKDIAHMASLIGVPLRIGSATARSMCNDNIKELNRDLNDFEKFDSMRELPSDSMHAWIHQKDQEFLDAFCRQNILDEDYAFEEHLVPVTLDLAHQAIYTELSHKLILLEMTKVKLEDYKRSAPDLRFITALTGCDTAEEALSKAAAHQTVHNGGADPLSDIISSCDAEERAARETLTTFATKADQTPNPAIDGLRKTLLDQNVLGDAETIKLVNDSWVDARPSRPTPSNPTRGNAVSEEEYSDAEGDSDDAYSGQLKTTKAQRDVATDINNKMKSFLTSVRASRYFTNLRKMQQGLSPDEQCDNPDCKTNGISKVAVSAFCGHLICKPCYGQLGTGQCPADGCYTTLHNYSCLDSDLLATASAPSKHGAKIEAAIYIVKDVRAKKEKAILFVQYKAQLKHVKAALADHRIAATVVEETAAAGKQIAEFAKNKEDVIVINASDETAAGSNIQAANHVIFLSPLLRKSQYTYDATMAQAIGRARRHGQTRKIHVYRICALNTIDVDILEHREKHTDAINELHAAEVAQPIGLSDLEMHDPRKPERTQLVCEDGKYSLRPHSWLYRCGADKADKFAENQAKSKRGDRVLGWEDFSSIPKFSDDFIEDTAS